MVRVRSDRTGGTRREVLIWEKCCFVYIVHDSMICDVLVCDCKHSADVLEHSFIRSYVHGDAYKCSRLRKFMPRTLRCCVYIKYIYFVSM